MLRASSIAILAALSAFAIAGLLLWQFGAAAAGAALLATVTLVVLLVMPSGALPSVALASFALLPVGYIPNVPPLVGRYLSPAVIVMVIWLLREVGAKRERKEGPPKTWAILFMVLLSLSTVSALWSLESGRTVLWTLTVGFAFFLPAIMSARHDPWAHEQLVKTWLLLGVALGAMAVIEGLTQMPLLGALYIDPTGAGTGVSQNWSSVRATTTLGHPLMNGTFLACTAAFGLIRAFTSGSRLAITSGVFAAAGTVFTVSRSAVAGLIVGLVVGTCVLLTSRNTSLSKKITWCLVSASVGLAAVSSPLLAERAASAEGTSSAKSRGMLLDRALEISVEDSYAGSGGGTSQLRATQAGLNLPIENSFGGVLVSLGVIGLIIFALLLIGLCISAARKKHSEIAAAVVTFSVTAAAYPLVDNIPTGLILLGFLAYLTFSKVHTGDKATKNSLGLPQFGAGGPTQRPGDAGSTPTRNVDSYSKGPTPLRRAAPPPSTSGYRPASE